MSPEGISFAYNAALDAPTFTERTVMITQTLVRLQNAWFNARDKESGQTLVEYALIISIVSLGAVAALVFLRGRITGLFSDAGSKIQQGSTLTG